MGKLLRNLLKSPMFVIGISIFIITLLIALLGPLFYHVDINARDIVAGPYAGSSGDHLLGTDHLGRDYVSLLIEGLRSSLYVGLVAGVIATTIGVLIGLFGGFRGGWIDEVLNMLTNIFIVIPQFVILVLISSAVKDGRSLTLIGLIIGLTAWSWSARAVRAQASSLRSRDHISLAKINGASTLTIVIKHVLPYQGQRRPFGRHLDCLPPGDHHHHPHGVCVVPDQYFHGRRLQPASAQVRGKKCLTMFLK